MMSKLDYRSNVIDLGGTYGAEMRMGIKLIDEAVQKSIDEVYRRLVPKRPWIWEKTATVADGTSLPSDYVSFVDLYYTLDSRRISFRYTPIPSWGAAQHNSSALGEAADPCFALCDHKVQTFPTGLSGLSLVYNAKPVQIFILNPAAQSTTQPPDSTMSDIPEDADGLVIRGAFERMTLLMTDEPEAFKLTQASLERIQQANMQVYVEQMDRLITSTKGGNDVAIH